MRVSIVTRICKQGKPELFTNDIYVQMQHDRGSSNVKRQKETLNQVGCHHGVDSDVSVLLLIIVSLFTLDLKVPDDIMLIQLIFCTLSVTLFFI
jgi:hypothetical protein